MSSRRTQDRADLRQLARAVTSEADAFVTRDASLLRSAEVVFDRFGLRLLRPAQLIGQIDQVLRERDHQPIRLAGTTVRCWRATRSAEAMAADFAMARDGERQLELAQRLNDYLARPDHADCFEITSDDKRLAPYVTIRSADGMEVPVLRDVTSRIGGTVARSVLANLSRLAACDFAGSILVTERRVPPALANALRELGFFDTSRGWLKTSVSGVMSGRQLAARVTRQCERIGISPGDAARILAAVPEEDSWSDPALASEAEHLFRPGKVRETALPAFILPIRPEWAVHLFDEGLARQTIFGGDAGLALNPESIYYRAAKPAVVRAPGRVLWYVSGDVRYDGVRRSVPARACLTS